MKTILSILSCLTLALSGCGLLNYLPPKKGVAPTAEQTKISNGLQSIATEIRKAENAAWTPAQFNADLNAVAAVLPIVAPYTTGAEDAYAAALSAGNLSVIAGEKLATRYDS